MDLNSATRDPVSVAKAVEEGEQVLLPFLKVAHDMGVTHAQVC